MAILIPLTSGETATVTLVQGAQRLVISNPQGDTVYTNSSFSYFGWQDAAIVANLLELSGYATRHESIEYALNIFGGIWDYPCDCDECA